jgi:hypothetical protein
MGVLLLGQNGNELVGSRGQQGDAAPFQKFSSGYIRRKISPFVF